MRVAMASTRRRAACSEDYPVGGGGQGGELWACGAWRFDQPDRGGDQESITAAGKALIVVVDRLVVVITRVGEQRGVQGVAGIGVGEHHVGDRPGQLAEFGQRRQDVFPVRDHARVDDHCCAAVADEANGARQPAAAGASAQQVHPGRGRVRGVG